MNLLGALDTKTSVQVMEILKRIAKDKLIIMVTHNAELANNYSTRIIKILDGQITEDSNPIEENEELTKNTNSSIGRTSMSFFTAFMLSLNNLLTKKGRTILVAFAGSIGIIGIALVQSVSNGFQAYIDKIQEDALTSYPLTIMEETTDIAGTLLAMTTKSDKPNNTNEVKEEQYITTMLSNLSKNDLKSFKKHIENNYNKIENDISNIKYGYSVEPTIYTIDATKKIAKLNPSEAFKTPYSSSLMMSSFSSIYSQMIDNKEVLNKSYDVLAGRWPEKYDEMIIVLSEPNKISDLLVYSLGLRDTEELNTLVTKIMNGEMVEINNEPLTLSYDDLMNLELKLIMPTDIYKYNEQYDIYEDMTKNENFLQETYNNAINLKIVGVVTAKEGVTSMALTPGVNYTSDLINYIIDYSANAEIVKKQIENEETDVFSGKPFNSKDDSLNLDFKDLVSVDGSKLQSAFNVNINQDDMQKQIQEQMQEISNSLSTDITPAKNAFKNNLKTLATEILQNNAQTINANNIEETVNNYLNEEKPQQIFAELESNYVIPKDTFKTTYAGILKALLQVFASTNSILIPSNIPELPQDQSNQNTQNNVTMPNINFDNIISTAIDSFIESAAIEETSNTMAKVMTEALMKKTVLTEVGNLTQNLSNSYANAFNVDQSKIASSFKLKMTEEEITRIITAMLNNTETNAKSNLVSLGYQDKEEPTYISFYFNSFDGKENFIDFLESYNKEMEEAKEEDKVINYTDTTGILMDSVKTIVNAVTYVLIAFVSISLVVSSIMIGIITYISVYERTKEIGILRAIGASKHNISSIFNAETFIIGLLSGFFGIGVTYALIPLVNKILHHFTGDIPLNVVFFYKNAIILVILSVILTLIGGLIPARAASKKDPVIALRTE